MTVESLSGSHPATSGFYLPLILLPHLCLVSAPPSLRAGCNISKNCLHRIVYRISSFSLTKNTLYQSLTLTLTLSLIRPSNKMSKKTWLITGCSSGFGELFVRQLTALGDQVVATGRNAETRLAHLKDTGATIIELDVTASQAEINMKFQQALEAYGTIDVIVHNAGFIQCGAVEELT